MRVWIASRELECARGDLLEPITQAKIDRYVENQAAARIRFEVNEFTLRAAVDSILNSN